MKSKFLKCPQCGDMVEVIQDAGVPMMCCGQKMVEMVPNTSDGAGEKHLPVVSVEKNTIRVKVGEIQHPMVEEHYIHWVYLETSQGCQRKNLNPGEEPNVVFYIGEEKPIAVYEYCNLHGLWKTEVK